MYSIEDIDFDKHIVAGVDEVGRGCYVGPVYAAAVILYKDDNSKEYASIRDSKKITSEKRREELCEYIKEKSMDWAVASLPVEYIDKHNILNASIECMRKALSALEVKPDFILVDGNQFLKFKDIQHFLVPGGDNKFKCIGAASIVAKVYRDEYITRVLDPQYPQYNWKKNKGYGTKEHEQAIRDYGITEYHRKKFVSKFKEPEPIQLISPGRADYCPFD